MAGASQFLWPGETGGSTVKKLLVTTLVAAIAAIVVAAVAPSGYDADAYIANPPGPSARPGLAAPPASAAESQQDAAVVRGVPASAPGPAAATAAGSPAAPGAAGTSGATPKPAVPEVRSQAALVVGVVATGLGFLLVALVRGRPAVAARRARSATARW
jgi:hypothetical protein